MRVRTRRVFFFFFGFPRRWEMYAAPRTCHALWTHGSRVRPAEQGGGGAHQQVRQTWTRLAFCDTWAVASRRRRGIRARLEVHHLPRRKRETPGTRSRAASTWCVPARVAMGCIHPCSRDPRVCVPQGPGCTRAGQRVATREARAGRGAHVACVHTPLLRRPARDGVLGTACLERCKCPVRPPDCGAAAGSPAATPREAVRTLSFRGRRSRNKVSVGEPAEGSLPVFPTHTDVAPYPV